MGEAFATRRAGIGADERTWFCTEFWFGVKANGQITGHRGVIIGVQRTGNSRGGGRIAIDEQIAGCYNGSYCVSDR